MDLSFESISQLTNFKCEAIYQDSSITIEGDQAKDLYMQVQNAIIQDKQTPTYSDHEYVYLVFYDGTVGSFSDNLNRCYGVCTIYDDNLLKFSLSPLHSAVYDYKVDIGLFDSVIDIISDIN